MSLQRGDIVQVKPDHKDPKKRGMLVAVDGVRDWGIVGIMFDHRQGDGWVRVSSDIETEPPLAYVRLTDDEFAPTGGKLVWPVNDPE